MHELSIAQSLIATVLDHLPADEEVERVTVVHLKLGALAGVVDDALQFCFDIATAGTKAQGAALCVRTSPVVIFCSLCQQEYALAGITEFCCPVCASPTADVRGGREIELESIELEVKESHANGHHDADFGTAQERPQQE